MWKSFLSIVALTVLFTCTASAATTYFFKASDGYLPLNMPTFTGLGLQAVDSITGSVTVEDTPFVVASTPTSFSSFEVTQFTLNVGGKVFDVQSDPTREHDFDIVDFIDPPNRDAFDFRALGTTPESSTIFGLSIASYGPVDLVTDRTSLPTIAMLNAAEIFDASFSLDGESSVSLFFQAFLWSDSEFEPTLAAPLQTVPIPSALPLLATSFASLGFVVWRRRRSN